MDNCGQSVRIWIIGPPGAGKTTLGKKISDLIGLPFYELDEFYWEEGWKRRPDDEFQKVIIETSSKNNWVIDGFYECSCDILTEKADMIIIIDLPLPIILKRVMKRSLKRIFNGEKVCGNNYESFKFLISREGLLLYTIKRYFFFRDKNFLCNAKNKIIKI